MQSENSLQARVLLFTQSDTIYLPQYIDGILSSGSTGIVAILILPAFSNVASMLKRTFALFGPILFVCLRLKHLLLSVLDCFLRAMRLPSRFSVQSVSRKHAVSCYSTRNDTFNGRVGAGETHRPGNHLLFGGLTEVSQRTTSATIPRLLQHSLRFASRIQGRKWNILGNGSC